MLHNVIGEGLYDKMVFEQRFQKGAGKHPNIWLSGRRAFQAEILARL